MGEHDFEWDDIYTGNASDYMEPDRQLLELVDALEPGRALDIGCGSGGLLAALAERGWVVTGVDIAPKAIEAARKVLAARGLRATLEVGDAARWRPDGQFDLVTSSFALPATRDEQAALFETIRAALAPGGRVLVKDFDAAMGQREELARFHCPSIDELVSAFDGFDVLRAEVVETPPHDHGEGHGHDDAPRSAALLYRRKPAIDPVD